MNRLEEVVASLRTRSEDEQDRAADLLLALLAGPEDDQHADS